MLELKEDHTNTVKLRIEIPGGSKKGSRLQKYLERKTFHK